MNIEQARKYLKDYAINNNIEIEEHLLNRYIKIISYYINNSYNNLGDKHHILPKSLYPEFIKNKDNIVKIPHKAHFICHLLLTRMFNNKINSLLFAFNTMKNTRGGESISGRKYEEERIKLSQILRENSKKMWDNPEIRNKIINSVKTYYQKVKDGDKDYALKEKNRNKQHSETLKTKDKSYWEEVRKKYQFTYSLNTEEQIKDINKKKSLGTKKYWDNISIEEYNYRSQISKYNTKKWWKTASEDEKLKRNKNNSLGQQNLSVISCPHCGKEMKSRGNMNKYHNDNCLHNPNLTEEQLQLIINKRLEWNRKNSEGQRRKKEG